MKLVCINDKITRTDSLGYLKKGSLQANTLEVGKVYDLPYYELDRYLSSKSHVRFWIEDGSYSLVFPKENFTTLEEWREIQLSKIL